MDCFLIKNVTWTEVSISWRVYPQLGRQPRIDGRRDKSVRRFEIDAEHFFATKG